MLFFQTLFDVDGEIHSRHFVDRRRLKVKRQNFRRRTYNFPVENQHNAMEDDQFLAWLMFVTRELTRVRNRASSGTNAGPRFGERNTFTAEDEGFLRWMGWRGEVEQERECSWPAEDLKKERLERTGKFGKRIRI
jgi:hypothetical protein